MAEVLINHIESAATLPWRWGERDCTLWVSDYVLKVLDVDPGAEYRGTYKTRLGCERILKRAGGLVDLISKAMNAVGVPYSPIATRGYVGIVMAHVPRREKITVEPTAAICLGQRRWAMFSPGGLIVSQTAHIAAWSIKCRRQ